MSLEERNKKVTDVYERFKIAEWGNGPKRAVSNFTFMTIIFIFCCVFQKVIGKRVQKY